MKSSNSWLFERICGGLSRSSGTLSGVVILAMMLVIMADVVGRYVFSSPILGSIELNRTLLVVAVYFGLSYTQLHEAHIRVDMVLLQSPVRLRLILELFALLVALGVYAVMTYMTIPVTYHSVSIGEYETGAISFPIWPARLLLTIGMFLFSLQIVADITAKLRRSRGKT